MIILFIHEKRPRISIYMGLHSITEYACGETKTEAEAAETI